jgi:hypothetical protein
MGQVVEAQIQTVEEIYRLVRAAVVSRRPITASYHGRARLFCPHRLGAIAKVSCGCCVTNTAERARADFIVPVRRQTGVALC